MEIDWSKAPEGATHYNHHDATTPWRKVDTGGTAYWWTGAEWVRVEGKGYYAGYIAIPNDSTPQWDGTGLPPVGAKVVLSDANHDVFEPYKEMIGVEVAVVASFASPAGFDMIACALPDGLCGCFRADMARPIRTPEQIAAEERERAIDDLCASIVSHYEAPKMSEHYLGLARALHDAGYRKQA